MCLESQAVEFLERKRRMRRMPVQIIVQWPQVYQKNTSKATDVKTHVKSIKLHVPPEGP